MSGNAELLTRPTIDRDWVADELFAAGIAHALNTVGLTDPCTLELLVDGTEPVRIELDAERAEDAGRAIAAALLERTEATWCVRATVHEEDVGAELLVSEWTGVTG